jgi:hypothetical protein
MATADQELAQRIEGLVIRVGKIADPESREVAEQLMASILELHGAGMERMMEIIFAAGDPGQKLIRRCAGDSLVAALLLLHNLHPDDLETRVRHAIGRWHGSAELVGAFEGAVRIRYYGGACETKEAIEAAIRDAAPDAVEIVIEESFHPNGFVPLAAIGMSIAEAD